MRMGKRLTADQGCVNLTALAHIRWCRIVAMVADSRARRSEGCSRLPGGTLVSGRSHRALHELRDPGPDERDARLPPNVGQSPKLADISATEPLRAFPAWVFRDNLFPPFGDDWACRGSDPRLPDVIRAGSAPIPVGAKDVHCLTRNGTAEVIFVSAAPDGPGSRRRGPVRPPVRQRGGRRPRDPVAGRPARLRPAGPVWIYPSPGSAGSGLSVMVERSDMLDGAFRFPARAVITFNLG